MLLWVNLVTDGLPATALAFNPPDTDAMRQPPRGRADAFVDTWTLGRYVLVGVYIGCATVGGYAAWFVHVDGGPRVSIGQLRHSAECATWDVEVSNIDCAVFADARPRALALTVLVTVEMANALNALSASASLLTHSPWSNPWLLCALALSLGQHLLLLYVPALASIFGVAPLGIAEWRLVPVAAAPVIALDELLKLISRRRARTTRPGDGLGSGLGQTLIKRLSSASALAHGFGGRVSGRGAYALVPQADKAA